MADVNDIWDEPTISHLTRRKSPSPLFISDHEAVADDRAAGPSHPTQTPPSDLDAIFAEIDDLDAPLPMLDFESVRKKAAAKHVTKVPTKRADVLISDGEEDNDAGASWKKNKDDKDEEKEKKPRKPVVKLDDERLLGPNGFPALLQQYKKFKPSKKGNEAADLKRLLQMYQLWAHKMYPKTQFRETVEKVEKLCRSRRMHSAMSTWRDDIYKKEHPEAEPEQEVIDLDDDGDENSGTRASAPQEPAPNHPNPKQFSGDDEWDLEAAIAEDEENRRRDTQTQIQSAPARPTLQMTEDDWDMDDMITQDEIAQQSSRMDNHTNTRPTPPSSKPAALHQDDDDMWDSDVAREMGMDPEADMDENEALPIITKGKEKEIPSVTNDPTPREDGLSAVEKVQLHTDDAGTWDDMYAD